MAVPFWGCQKKPYPETIINTGAVFYFEGLVNGQRVRFDAGRDDYYMYSSHSMNQSQLYRFSASLRKNVCKNCGDGFDFYLNGDHIPSSGSPVLTDTTFAAGPRQFAGNSDSVYNVSLKALFNRNASGYLWEFSDGTKMNGETVTHRFPEGHAYDICLRGTSTQGCQSDLCNRQDFSEGAVRTLISATPYPDSTILFTQHTTGSAPFSFFWDFGDGQTSTQMSHIHRYKIPGSYPVTLTVKDSKGRVATARYNVVTLSDQSSCAVNYEIAALEKVYQPAFSKVIIKWRREGKIFSSEVVDQKNSSFQIVEVSDYELNEKGEKTKKIKVLFSCRLSDGFQEINITNAEAVIAVSYP